MICRIWGRIPAADLRRHRGRDCRPQSGVFGSDARISRSAPAGTQAHDERVRIGFAAATGAEGAASARCGGPGHALGRILPNGREHGSQGWRHSSGRTGSGTGQRSRRGHQRLALYLAVVDFRYRACDRYHRSASQKQVEATAARAMKRFRVLLRDDLGRGTRYGIRLLRLHQRNALYMSRKVLMRQEEKILSDSEKVLRFRRMKSSLRARGTLTKEP